MKISTKNDLCGVLNNGPLMVSIGRWANVTNSPYAFTKMRKNPDLVSSLSNSLPNGKETQLFTTISKDNKNDIDLFILPDHVTSYIVRSQSEEV